MKKPKAEPIAAPHVVHGSAPASGPPILPIERMKLFSPGQWEEFLTEWATGLGSYGRVEKVGGPGDMGCDVIATVDSQDPNSSWDNYQCKHLDHALEPDDVWVELGKVCYYTYIGEYDVPRRYLFVSPRGVGTSVARLLKNPDDLKAKLLTKWAKKCEGRIRKKHKIPLDDKLRSHIEAMNFSIFGYVTPHELIEGHAKTRYFALRFGTPLPPRPTPALPPEEIAASETRYVRQLLDAYESNRGVTYPNPEDLDDALARHFKRSREWFYCAEELRNFSRDSLPDGAFEHLQKQIYDGVIDTCEGAHPCGLTRVNATTAQAASLTVTSSALVGRVDIADKKGICHQLANEDQLIWVPK